MLSRPILDSINAGALSAIANGMHSCLANPATCQVEGALAAEELQDCQSEPWRLHAGHQEAMR